MVIRILTSFHSLQEQGESLGPMEQALGRGSVGELIGDIPRGSLVVPRFRAIPFGELLQREVEAHGSQLVNTFHQHRNIADSSNWNHLLGKLTIPEFGVADLPDLPEGEYFVKGETNSIKHQWLKSCYAPDRKSLVDIVNNFQRDGFAGNQRVVIKSFCHFRQLLNRSGQKLFSLSGQPIWHERRVFVLDGQALAQGFYWSSFLGDAMPTPIGNGHKFMETLTQVIERTKHLARFYVVDMAENEDGSWTVIELNDGSMSGLSQVDPLELWTNFRKVGSSFNPKVELNLHG